MIPTTPLRVIDLMCDHHRQLILRTRLWPRDYGVGNDAVGGTTCAACAVVAARKPSVRPTLLPDYDIWECAAIHEAGHAVALSLAGIPVRGAVLAAAESPGKVTAQLDEHQASSDVLLIALWAGQAANRYGLLQTGPVSDADLIDLANVSFDDCMSLWSTGRSVQDITVTRDRADTLVERHWDAVYHVAAALLSDEWLSGYEIAGIVGQPARLKKLEEEEGRRGCRT